MRRESILCLVTLVLLAAWALAPPAAFGAADITNTKHDFVNTGFGGSTTSALCGTCHYPHTSSSSSANLVWNHTLSGNTLTFGTSATTIAGTTLPSNIASWTGTTKYCLSCHDGTVAVGDLIKGTDWGPSTNKITGNAVIGSVSGSTTDLTGNHPVAVPYPGSSSAYNGISSAADTGEFVAVASVTGVKIFTVGTAKGIECASCHNPHRNISGGNKFLRVAYNATGDLCLSCHANK